MQGERTYLMGVVLAGALVLAAGIAYGARDPAAQLALSLPQTLLVAGLAVGSWLVLRNLLLLRWRGQHVALAPDETLVVLALLALPAVPALLFAVPPMAWFQVRTKRTFLKGAFNVATLLLATAAAIGAFQLAAALGAPAYAAVVLAIPLYTVTTHLLVSGVFALREHASPVRVFRERFLIPSALHVALGLGSGLALVALWAIHPVAVLALAPFAWLARENMGLAARAERQLEAQRVLGDAGRDLVGTKDMDAAAQRILAVAGALFRAGRVEIELDGPPALAGRRWGSDLADGSWPQRPLEARLPAREGQPSGFLRVHPSQRTDEAYGESDAALLTIVAGEAAAALAHAQALQTIDDARAQLEATRVARPFVRRIVRSLMDETEADPNALLRVGEALARETEGEREDVLLRGYAEMGLGALTVSSHEGDRAAFEGRDLFERAPGARKTTCYLALGFLVGVVRRTRGGDAVGTETTCESRGDAHCCFVVVTRPGIEKRMPAPGGRAPVSASEWRLGGV